MKRNKFHLGEEKYYLKMIGEEATIGRGIIDLIEEGPKYRLQNHPHGHKNTSWCGDFREDYLFDSTVDALSKASAHAILGNNRTREAADYTCADRLKNLKKLVDAVDAIGVTCDNVTVELSWTRQE